MSSPAKNNGDLPGELEGRRYGAADVTIRPAGPVDLAAVTEIYNEAILNTTSTMQLTPRDASEHDSWLESTGERHPFLVAESSGDVVGWARLKPWSEWPGYADTVELSVFVHRDFRGRGVGGALVGRILETGRAAGLHSVVSRISGDNEVSVRLHRAFGFGTVGVQREAGRKFGRRLDIVIMQLNFPEPGE